MTKYLTKFVILTLLLYLFVVFFDSSVYGMKFITDVGQDYKPIVIFMLVLSILNIFIKPILKLVTLPFTCITLGLFTLVINLIIMLSAEYLVDGFKFLGIKEAFLFSIGFSIISSILDYFLKDKKK